MAWFAKICLPAISKLEISASIAIRIRLTFCSGSYFLAGWLAMPTYSTKKVVVAFKRKITRGFRLQLIFVCNT